MTIYWQILYWAWAAPSVGAVWLALTAAGCEVKRGVVCTAFCLLAYPAAATAGLGFFALAQWLFP